MASIHQCQETAALAPCKGSLWRIVLGRLWDRMRAHWRRQREQQELYEYLASDYRAAADIGLAGSEAHALAQRPFWKV